MKKNTKAFILCGGKGKRLKPFTDKIPKSLLEIKKDLTILDKQLIDFKEAGIKDIYLLTSYLGEKIKERYGKEWKGLNIYYPEEKEPSGTLRALRNCLKDVDSDIIGMNGDIVSDYNVKEFLKSSQNSDNLVTIVVTKLQSPYGVLELKDDKITSFVEKPVLDHYINAGIYYFKKESFPYFFQDYEGNDLEKTVFPELAENSLVGYYYENVFWESIDSIKDLERVRKEFKNR